MKNKNKISGHLFQTLLNNLEEIIEFKVEQKMNELLPTSHQSNYLTVKEAADYSNVSVKTIYSWLQKSLLPYSRPTGGKCMIDKNEIDEFLNNPKTYYKSIGQLKKEAKKYSCDLK